MGSIRQRIGVYLTVAVMITVAAWLFSASSGGDDPEMVAPGDGPTAGASGTPSPGTTPTPTPTVPELPLPAAYDEARELLRAGEFGASAAAYRALAERESDPALAAHALTGAAVALHEGGDREGSIAALRDALATAPAGSSTAFEAAYLLALRLVEADEPEGAAGVLAPFAAQPPAHGLRVQALALYAKALSRAGNTSAADATWEALLAEPGLPVAVAAGIADERAKQAEREGDTAGQVLWLTNYVELQPTAEARSALAFAAGLLGDTATQEAQLRLILSEAPGSVFSLLALEALDEQGLAVDPGLAGFVLYRGAQYVAARDRLEAAVLASAEVAADATPVAVDPVPPADRVFRRYYLAASYEALGDFPTAIAYYDQAAAIEAQTPFTHRAKWWAARLTEDLADNQGASQRYLALALDGPPGEFSEEAAFRAGLVLIRSADPAGAIVTWDALGLSNDPRLLYWRGRALAATGDPTAAAAAYEAARAADPNSFHGIEAARELGEPVEGPGGYVPLPESTAPGWAELEAWLVARVPGQPVVLPIAGAVDDLVLLGLRDEAAALLQEVAATGGPWELLAVARVAQETGLTTQALRYGFQLHAAVAPGETDIPVALLRLEYPLDYVTLLDSLARAHDLDPLWMAALVRQESLWDPRAGSIAGALGLTQVIPETGASIAANLGVTDFVTSDLFRPSTSLRFGAFYIAAQVGAFGNPYAALAAYNAGPGNAARWLEGLGGGSPADFVERIDFSETYHYVQLVSEHHAHYVGAYR